MPNRQIKITAKYTAYTVYLTSKAIDIVVTYTCSCSYVCKYKLASSSYIARAIKVTRISSLYLVRISKCLAIKTCYTVL